MSKNIHFTGQPLYSQLLNLIEKQKINELSRQGGHDRYIKNMTKQNSDTIQILDVKLSPILSNKKLLAN